MVTVWLTGLPGSGKSTVATLAADELRRRGRAVEILDGDVVRTQLSSDLGFTPEDRKANADRVAFVANLLSRNGIIALVALITPYRESRERARALMPDRFLEVFVNASANVCIRRDPKRLYTRALAGEPIPLTGISAPYEPPEHPDLVLDTERERPDRSAARVLELIDARIES